MTPFEEGRAAVQGLATWLGIGFLAFVVAMRKGYSIAIAFALGVLGLLGLIIAILLPRTSEGRAQAELEDAIRHEINDSQELLACPNCGRQNSIATRICPRCEYRYNQS